MAYTPWLYYYQTGGTVAASGDMTSPHTFTPDTANTGWIYYESATANGAQAGTGGFAVTALGAVEVGQAKPADYQCREAFLAFDTSGIPDGATISSAVLELYGWYDNSTTDFTLQARTYDFGATLENADYRSDSQLGALTLLASIASSAMSFGAYNTLTESGTALRDAINKTGVTRILFCSDRHVAGTDQTGDEYVAFYTTVTQPAKLTVTWT